MYSVVLATVLLAGTAAPDFGGKSCHGCYGACYGACYGVGYSGWSHGGCYGGCGGCYGGGCFGGCGGCYGGWSACYGGCCGGCYGGWSSCYGGCGGCYGGCSGWSCGGCYGGYWGVTYSHAAPVTYGHSYVTPNYAIAPSNSHVISPSNAPAYHAPMNHEAIAKKPATVVVKAATDVKILFNGQETKRKKDEEVFKTPELTSGKTYSYDVVAEVSREGKTYTASQRVTVRAGERSEVSFGDATQVIAAAQETVARITVLLPEGGKLFVDGTERGSGAAKQTFDTPKLVKGKTYYYTLKVEAKAANNAGAKTQRVNVEAGKEVTVDFRSMSDSAE